MQFYIHALQKGGNLFLSGLYDFDEQDIVDAAEGFGLKFAERKSRNEWVALKFNYE